MKLQAAASRPGVTVIELLVTLTLATIIMSGIGAALVESQAGWSWMYNRAFGDMASDAYVARKTFEAVVCKASTTRDLLADGGGEVTVYYYQDPETSLWLDRCARFYVDQEQTKLMVDYGELDQQGDPAGLQRTVMLARDVAWAKFGINGACVEMISRLDSGSTARTVVASGIRYNQ